jgi:predicted secreted protein with PEFG-CTERM motif
LFAIIPLALIPTGIAFGSHVFDKDAFAQYLDISQLSSEKFTLKVDDKSYDIYYGYHGSMEVDVNKVGEELPKLSSMDINEERKSIEITMESVPSVSVLWLRLPFEVISAENEQFHLVIDGVDTQYDITKFPQDYAIGMMIPKDAKHIEIIGTRVIPEFGSISIIILGISIIGIIYIVNVRKHKII